MDPRLAYEAYTRALGRSLPDWDGLTVKEREAWAAAVAALVPKPVSFPSTTLVRGK